MGNIKSQKLPQTYKLWNLPSGTESVSGNVSIVSKLCGTGSLDNSVTMFDVLRMH